jgi:pimeloyl-ACP methyl ester carboxylesterase
VLDEAARACRVRVLAPERPGLGLSSPQPRRTLLDTARDVRALAAALRISSFAILGESGGGPYALACAHDLSDCVTGVAIACGLGPPTGRDQAAGIAPKQRVAYAVASKAPFLAAHALVPAAACARRWPRQFLRVTRWQLGKADRQALDGPLGALVAADYAEAFRQGAHGAAHDLALLFKPWPFDLGEIRPSVSFFHGARDRTVPVSTAHRLARIVPGSRLHIYDEHGHFSLLALNAEAILAEVIAEQAQ